MCKRPLDESFRVSIPLRTDGNALGSVPLVALNVRVVAPAHHAAIGAICRMRVLGFTKAVLRLTTKLYTTTGWDFWIPLPVLVCDGVAAGCVFFSAVTLVSPEVHVVLPGMGITYCYQ